VSADEDVREYKQRLAIARVLLRRGRVISATTTLLIVAAFEALILPCARAYGGFRGLMLILLPVAVAAMVLSFLLTDTVEGEYPTRQ
jgi:hypothetical protein